MFDIIILIYCIIVLCLLGLQTFSIVISAKCTNILSIITVDLVLRLLKSDLNSVVCILKTDQDAFLKFYYSTPIHFVLYIITIYEILNSKSGLLGFE